MSPLSSASLRPRDPEEDSHSLAMALYDVWIMSGSPLTGPLSDRMRAVIANVPWLTDKYPVLRELN